MANPPPPYDNITGISRAVMKDNAQETLGNYNGNARPGELVVDLTQDPPPLYVGNNSGQLTLVASGGGGYGNTQVAQFLAAGLVGNIIPAGNGVNSLGNSTNYWANLWIANNTIYLGGVPLGMTAGNVLTVNGNNITGTVTFSNEAVIGTGASNTVSGLYLAPDPGAFTDGMYLRVRGNTISEATHIHFDTGNNQYFSQFIGDDNKYVELANTGNIVINTNNYAGNTAQWNFSTDGVLTLPAGSSRITSYGQITIETDNNASGMYLNADSVNLLYANANVTLRANSTGTNKDWNFDSTGNLTLPGATAGETIATSGGYITVGNLLIGQGGSLFNSNNDSWALYGNISDPGTSISIPSDAAAGNGTPLVLENQISNVEIRSGFGTWTFGNTSNLTLPLGGIVYETNIPGGALSGNTIALKPSGGTDADQQLLIYPTVGPVTDANHLHLTTGNLYNTELFLGNDDLYVKLANTGNVVINSNSAVGNTAQWTFGTDGNLTLPGNTFAVNYANGNQVAVSDPSQTILPTIQSITVETRPAGLFGGGQGGANVTVANVIPVTEYGVIITSGTSNEKYKTGSLGSIPGTVSLTFNTGLNSTQYSVYAYVTSNAGTFYSNSATGTSGICLLAGTQIALSDGSYKAIEHITYTDKMLSRDFDRGCYAETTALWIKRGETGSQYNLLTFSDGTTLRTFDQHRIFNKQAGAFTYPMTDATPVGTVTVNQHGQEITLIDKQVVVDTIEYYNVITDYHMNLFSDSILTSCRFNNIYPIQDMKFVKDSRPLRSRSEFHQIDDRFFHGLRLAEQQFDLAMIEWYVARLESLEIDTDVAVAV